MTAAITTIPRPQPVALSNGYTLPAAHPVAVARAVKAALPPSVRAALIPEWSGPFSDSRISGYAMAAAVPDADRRAALALLESAAAPMPPRQLIAALTELRLLTRSKPADEAEIELQLAAYVKRLSQWPAYIVEHVLARRAEESPWWPTWAELHDDLSRHAEIPKMIAALREATP